MMQQSGIAADRIRLLEIGAMTCGALKAVLKIHDAMSFNCDMKLLIEWLQDEGRKYDKEFVEYLVSILLTTKGIINHTFSPIPTVTLGIRSILYLPGETYIDDDLIFTILHLFKDAYGQNGKYFFIPPSHISIWSRNSKNFKAECFNWLNDEVKCGPAKGFAVVPMDNHWGMLVIDFERRVLAFGDSLGRCAPMDTLLGIQHWLRRQGVKLSEWSKKAKKYRDIPMQPVGSGSCGIIALNTIERALNPSVERWTHERSYHHRMRLLALAVGYEKVGSL